MKESAYKEPMLKIVSIGGMKNVCRAYVKLFLGLKHRKKGLFEDKYGWKTYILSRNLFENKTA